MNMNDLIKLKNLLLKLTFEIDELCEKELEILAKENGITFREATEVYRSVIDKYDAVKRPTLEAYFELKGITYGREITH